MTNFTESDQAILLAAEHILRELDARYNKAAYQAEDDVWQAVRLSRIAGTCAAVASSLSSALVTLDVYGPKTEPPAATEQVTA